MNVKVYAFGDSLQYLQLQLLNEITFSVIFFLKPSLLYQKPVENVFWYLPFWPFLVSFKSQY